MNKISLREVFNGVRLAVKMTMFRHCMIKHGTYVYEVEAGELDEINHALEGVDEWDWDIWRLKEVTKGRPLQTLGWHLLHKWDLIGQLKLDCTVVRNWLVFVEGLYQDNAYHSSTHAADVLQAVNYLLSQGGASECLCPTTTFALLVAAMVHDAGHDGYNNLYHQHAQTARALDFNDQSVQENYHLRAVFTRMAADARVDLLAALRPDAAREVRRLVILCTLATDMTGHFKHLQDFRGLVGARGAARADWRADPDLRDRLCANLLHAADLSNPCRRFDIARRCPPRAPPHPPPHLQPALPSP